MKLHAWMSVLTGCLLGASSSVALGAGLTVNFVEADLSTLPADGALWSKAPEIPVSLMAQPMVTPKPKETSVPEIKVQALHDGRWMAFRLSWADAERSDGGKLGKYSDAVAVQFPQKNGPNPPPVFMGMKDAGVHILHWRAQYQVDKEQGLKMPQDYYPNMQIDMYPMEYADFGQISSIGTYDREIYSPGLASGNPQAQRKIRGVDEILAEGFGSSTIAQNAMAVGQGVWKDGRWTVILARPMNRENGSILMEGSDSWVGFAVWQGSKDEVGSRKSVTMSWTPMRIELGAK